MEAFQAGGGRRERLEEGSVEEEESSRTERSTLEWPHHCRRGPASQDLGLSRGLGCEE